VVGDGPQRKYIEEKNASNMTYVGGFVDNIEDVFSSGDMFLFIGNEYRRDLTMICYEALASGLPVLAPDFGYDSIFVSGKNCVLKEREPKSLMDGIEELLDESRRAEISRNAVKSVRELTWPNYVNRLDEILETTREKFSRGMG
jgi:glycosyltransferase involved in cell wall biosynthesis